jgi:hypothetical protein
MQRLLASQRWQQGGRRPLNAQSVGQRESRSLDTGAYQTLAEFAIALSGFVGLVVAFRQREGRFHPADDFRIFIALVPALAGAFLALLPVGLDMLVLEPVTTLVLSSVIYAAVVLLVLLVIAIKNGRLPPDAKAVLSRPLTLFFYALFGFSVVANLANAMSLFGEPRGGVYFLGIVAILVNSATVFARIVFIRPTA